MRTKITSKTLTDLFKKRIVELQEEPEFQWSEKRIKYATDHNGEPSIKIAVGNVSLDYDLWENLRNPALIGLYPAGLQEIWEFYANRIRPEIDASGRQTIFRIPRQFNYARKNFSRAVVISLMLPFSPKIMKNYSQLILAEKKSSSHLFSRMFEDVELMIDKATARVGVDLVKNDNVVVAMDTKTVKSVSVEAVPSTHQGDSHGPCKIVNYPQKSIAVLMGLGQFGVSRIVFRDESANGEVQRFIGPIRSIVVFDKEDLVTDGNDDIVYPTEAWRQFLFKLSDFTVINAETNQYRFCSSIPSGEQGCRKCIRSCPTVAQMNSSPSTEGGYPERILKQIHRFWEGKLQFDFAQCYLDRTQMKTLFPEWSCARCVTICATLGQKKINTVDQFYKKAGQLTKTKA